MSNLSQLVGVRSQLATELIAYLHGLEQETRPEGSPTSMLLEELQGVPHAQEDGARPEEIAAAQPLKQLVQAREGALILCEDEGVARDWLKHFAGTTTTLVREQVERQSASIRDLPLPIHIKVTELARAVSDVHHTDLRGMLSKLGAASESFTDDMRIVAGVLYIMAGRKNWTDLLARTIMENLTQPRRQARKAGALICLEGWSEIPLLERLSLAPAISSFAQRANARVFISSGDVPQMGQKELRLPQLRILHPTIVADPTRRPDEDKTPPVSRAPARSTVRRRFSLKVSFQITVAILLTVVTGITAWQANRRFELTPRLSLRLKGPRIDLAAATTRDSFQPISNLAWGRYGQDFGDVPSWTGVGIARRRKEFAALLRPLAEGGVRGIVWFLFADGRASPEFDPNGFVTGLDESFWQDYDAAIELARERDLAIIWVLIDWRWMTPMTRQNAASLGGHSDVIEDPPRRRSLLNAFESIVRRSRYERHVAGWILLNEPENALKDGFVTPQAVDEFAREAAAVVHRVAPKQPVSIGRVSLESLVAHQATDSSIVDFYAFHHYKPFLPPPVEHIRAVMPARDSRPIYIGEFDVETPPAGELARVVRWARALDYGGVWPWAVHIREGEAPRLREMQTYASLVRRVQGENGRPQTLAGVPEPESQDGRQWWLAHGRTVTSLVAADIEKIGSELPGHVSGLSENEDWAKRTTDQIRREEINIQQFQSVLAEARQRHAENRRAHEDSHQKVENLTAQLSGYRAELERAEAQLRENKERGVVNPETQEWVDRLKNKDVPAAERNLTLENKNEADLRRRAEDSTKWVTDAERDLERSETELENQRRDLEEARRRLASHRYLHEAKQAEIGWLERLYLRYWQSER